MDDNQRYVLALWEYRLTLQKRIHQLAAEKRAATSVISFKAPNWNLLKLAEGIIKQTISYYIAPPSTEEDHLKLAKEYDELCRKVKVIQQNCQDNNVAPELSQMEAIAKEKAKLGAEPFLAANAIHFGFTPSEQVVFRQAQRELQKEKSYVFDVLEKQISKDFDEKLHEAFLKLPIEDLPRCWNPLDPNLKQHHQTCYAIAEAMYKFRVVPAGVFALAMVKSGTAIYSWNKKQDSPLTDSQIAKKKGALSRMKLWGALVVLSFLFLQYIEYSRKNTLNLARSLEEKRELAHARISCSNKSAWPEIVKKSQASIRPQAEEKIQIMRSLSSCCSVCYAQAKKCVESIIFRSEE